MLTYKSLAELVEAAEKRNTTIGRVVLEHQASQKDMTPQVLFEEMRARLRVMQESSRQGLAAAEKSPSGLSGGGAVRIRANRESGKTVGGSFFAGMIARAMAVSERNACMGRIVAAPTAGSCGILPAVLISLAEEHNISEDDVVEALFTASGVGMVIAARAFLSGAEGGCQAECGSASAMAAAAAAEMLGGFPRTASQACAMALMNVLGLVCDPVAGLVEEPCVKRNAAGAANALAAAEMAMAGVESAIPADEVIDAMRQIGQTMPPSLRETARGGLAASPTGRDISAKLGEVNAKK